MSDKQAAIEALEDSPSLELFNVILELLEHAEEQPLKDILNNIDNIEGRVKTILAALQSNGHVDVKDFEIEHHNNPKHMPAHLWAGFLNIGLVSWCSVPAVGNDLGLTKYKKEEGYLNTPQTEDTT